MTRRVLFLIGVLLSVAGCQTQKSKPCFCLIHYSPNIIGPGEFMSFPEDRCEDVKTELSFDKNGRLKVDQETTVEIRTCVEVKDTNVSTHLEILP